MGKKNRINNKKKHKKNNTQKNGRDIIHDSLTITIATPTQFERTKYLDILIQCILQQDYANILEWIIVDGTQDNEHKLRTYIDHIRKTYKDLPEIVFIEPDENNTKSIGNLRNLYNEKCRGDIIVCMDDDDYYPYNRISHAVFKLKNSIFDIGGCSGLNIYSVQFQKVYLWKRFHLNQGGNASLAYTNKYAKTHFYDNVSCGEEKSFIKNYMGFKCEPGKEREQTMIQFDTDKSLISIAHMSTFNKSKLFAENELREQKNKFIYHSMYTLERYVNNSTIMDMYKKTFNIEHTDKNDLTFFYVRQGRSININQFHQESEFNQLHLLANYYSNQGKCVTVYTNFTNNTIKRDGINIQDDSTKIINNVKYKNYFTIDSRIKYKNIIAIDQSSLILMYELNISYDNLYYIHNSHIPLESKYLNNVTITKFITRNHYSIQDIIKKDNCIHIPRGIDTKLIQNIIDRCKIKNIQKNYYRLCYVNSFENGLLPILQYVYPELKKLQPKIELHVYGSIRDNVVQPLVDMINKHLIQDGIINHGICNTETIIEEKLQSGFHLNFIDYPKMDNLSIKESLYCGCMPLISNKNCFKELIGIHFDLNTQEIISYKKVAHARILTNMENNPNSIIELQHKICNEKNKQYITTMDSVYELWNSILL